MQFAPELLSAIKIRVDQFDQPGQYLLTGSQNLSMLKSVAESMAGRVGIIHLGAMTPHEKSKSFDFVDSQVTPKHWVQQYLEHPGKMRQSFDGLLGCAPVTGQIWKGGFPGLLELEEELIPNYFKSYLQTYIERDIRTIVETGRLMQFENFVAILAALSSQEVNRNHLGRELDIDTRVARRWLDVMQTMYLWREVMPYMGNTIKRVTRKRKGYFVDTGFACWLHNINSPIDVLGHPLKGALFEKFIANMVHAVLQSIPFGVGVYHWRSNGGAEVDIVLYRNNSVYPIEVKMKSNVTAYDARGIKAFQETYKDSGVNVMPGIIVSNSEVCYQVASDITVVPWNMLCK